MQHSDSDKLDSTVLNGYPKLHADGAFGNPSYTHYLPLLRQHVYLAGRTVLDYGCGPDGGLINVLNESVISYDPFVLKYSESPWGKPFQVFFSADVLEHLTVRYILEVLHGVAEAKPEHIFLAVSTRAANKKFDNGVNLHLTVEPISWWRGLLQGIFHNQYRLVLASSNEMAESAVFCLRRHDFRAS